jgi:predicted acyltransferase (DUF342 family)
MTTAQTTKRFPAIIMIATFCAVASACTTIYGAGLMKASVVGGPMTIDGPMTVNGSLTVGGPATVHGAVGAQKLIVGGPVETTFPHGEPPGPAGQTVSGDPIVGGPLTVNGQLVVAGTLKIGGPLKTEVSENNETYSVTE